MLGDDPPYLSVGTEVSAKYKGAFCEAKIRKVVRSVKCRVTYKQGLGTATVADDQIKGVLRVGASVEAKHNDKKDYVEATITKIQDCSQYTVVFDDGDITTLRRTALCLKSGRHFAESETLDQLPLTHPEHFGNPVIGGRRGRRSRAAQDDSSDDEGSPPRGMHDSASGGSGKEGMETEPEIGRVVCVELGDKKKKDNWFPGLVVAPTAQDTVRIRVRDDYLVRSFKDARYYTVPKKEATEFTKELVNKVENSALKVAVEKALLFLEKNELPPHWDRDLLFGNGASSGNSDSDGELDSDSSDDEPREEKDHFVAQLYKFMDDRGTPINNCPMIGNEDIDLYRLFRAVYKMGGYNRVTNQNQWKSVTRRLSFSMQSNSSTYNLVKQAYKKFLHSFEDFYRKLGCTMVNHPRGSIRKQRPGRSLIRDKDRNTPVPLAVLKPEKEDDEREIKEEPKKKSGDEEKKEKTKKEAPKEEETPKSSKRKQQQPQPDDEDESVSEKESDEVTVDAEEESSSSDKSQKRSNSVMKNRTKYKKEKDESKRKITEKRSNKTDSKSNQDKKEEKSKDAKEEDSAKTRSKSKEDAGVKKVDKGDSGDGSGSSKDSEKSDKAEKSEKKVSKQKRITDEELKKRGRKRKDATDGEKRSATDDNKSEYNTPSYKGPVEIGDRLQVYYGPNHESKVTYEAKVVDVDHTSDPSGVLYLVHYTGWNTRYDEWIKASRIAQNFTQTQGRVKRTKSTPRPQTPSSTKSSSDKSSNRDKNFGSSTPGVERGRRRAQSVAPFSEKKENDSKKDSDKDADKSSARSSTPTSSCSNRTKSPAVLLSQRALRGGRNTESLCPIELRRRVRKVSGQTDASLVVSDSEESNSYESDTTEPEQTPKSKAKATPIEERSRREARKRAESRIKVEADNSDIEQEKESTEEPRRGRRLRRTLGKIQPDVKSEPDSDEDQPKGRDFDLNQIRSELKGFDKAVKMDMMRVDQEDSKSSEKEPETPPVLVAATASPKPEKKPDVKVEPTETKLEDNTEDIYEFKEPEPFEFEVRNKRDFNNEKDKLKKRPFEEEAKMSPKKKLKVVSPKEVIKQETESPGAEYKKRSRQKVTKVKTEEIAGSPSRQPSAVAVTPCEEAFDKMCENNAQIKKEVSETSKISTNLNLLFNNIDAAEEVKERVVPVEVSRQSPFTVQKETPIKDDKNDKNEKQKVLIREEKEEVPVAVVKTPVVEGKVSDQKLTTKANLPLVIGPAPTPVATLVPIAAESKCFEYISPMLTPSVAATIPIAARLPATSSIEEKLAAAVAYTKRERESKEVEEQPKKLPSKKSEVTSSTEITTVRKGAKKYVKEEPKKIAEDVLPKECTEIKEEVKKEVTVSVPKTGELKKGDKWTKADNQMTNWECLDKGKSLLNQEFADSTDSSDSERRLVIDNEDFQEEKPPPASVFEKPFLPKTEEPEKDKKVSSLNAKSSRTDEDRENMSSLLCEEEIPGSPTSELEEKEEPCSMAGTRTSPKTGAQESALASLMEMPFASAPTSSEQSKGCESSTTMSISLAPSCSIAPSRMAQMAPQPQHEPVVAPVAESNEAAPVMDNTPPTTPDSSISNISESPREERTGGSSPMSEDNSSKPNRDSSEGEEAKRPSQNQQAEVDPSMMPLSLAANKPPAKRSYEETPSPKKRKRNRKHSETGTSAKKSIRQSGRNGRQGPASDSDDTNEGPNLYVGTSNVSNFGATPTTTSSTASTVISTATSTTTSTATVATPTNTADHGNYSSRSPRPMKYNFYVELDPELDGSQRIAVLQQKLSELRKTYNSVKVELAGIERRRKKLKRREREAMKAAKAEMQQACS